MGETGKRQPGRGEEKADAPVARGAFPSERDTQPTIAELLALIERHFGQTPEKITAPGGKGRDSLRVHLKDRTVIVTWRENRRRRAREIEVLKRLSRAGAPVPHFLGAEGPVFFQEDLGSVRLSSRLEHAMEGGRRDLAERVARATFASLERLSRIGMKAGLDEIAPKMGLRGKWRVARVERVRALSELFGLAPPEIDAAVFAEAILPRRLVFVKWDARPGNATIHENRVKWYDWEYCGLREGLEDHAFLGADEFWPFPPERTLALLDEVRPLTAEDRAWLADYAVLHVVERLGYIAEQVERNGWIDEGRARRHDRIGYAPRLLSRLVSHGTGWAEASAHGQALAQWFPQMEAALRDRYPPAPSPSQAGAL